MGSTNPLAAQIERLTKQDLIVPKSLLNAYNDAVMPIEAAVRIVGHKLDDYPFGTVQRVSLERGVLHDIATGLGIPDKQLAATNVSPGESNSIIVSLEIKAPPPAAFNLLSPTALANALRMMVMDRNSLLYQGTFTKDVDPTYYAQETKYQTAKQRREARIHAIQERLAGHAAPTAAAPQPGAGTGVAKLGP